MRHQSKQGQGADRAIYRGPGPGGKQIAPGSPATIDLDDQRNWLADQKSRQRGYDQVKGEEIPAANRE